VPHLVEDEVQHGGLGVELDALVQPWTTEVHVDQVLHAVLSCSIITIIIIIIITTNIIIIFTTSSSSSTTTISSSLLSSSSQQPKGRPQHHT